MEDNTEAGQEFGGSGDTAAGEGQTQKVQDKESKDMEIENDIEGIRENFFPESAYLSAFSNAEVLGDSHAHRARQKKPPSPDDNAKEFYPASVQVENDIGELELNTKVPENGLLDGNLEHDATTNGNNQEGMEEKVKKMKALANNGTGELDDAFTETEVHPADEVEVLKNEPDAKTSSKSFLLDANDVSGDESGTEEEQCAFMKELDTFHRKTCLDFKPPKFYQEPLNCLKLWRAVIRLGGYEQVTSLKLWRQVGESFRPPKTCTTVSWTFRGFYEKALLEYEKYKMRSGELPFTNSSLIDPASVNQADLIHPSGSGRARRDAAARAMQGWHSQRLLGNGEVGDPIIKDKNPITTPKREKQLRNIGFLKRKGSSPIEPAAKVAHAASKSHDMDGLEIMVVDVGVPAEWVKVNVQRMKDCYEVYALVPGLLREEVRVQSDPAGRLVISGQPEQRDNLWGVTPFKKVVSLPTRIDPHHTSAVVTLHGQLFIRVPFEQVDM